MAGTLVHYFPFISGNIADDVGDMPSTLTNTPIFSAGPIAPWMECPDGLAPDNDAVQIYSAGADLLNQWAIAFRFEASGVFSDTVFGIRSTPSNAHLYCQLSDIGYEVWPKLKNTDGTLVDGERWGDWATPLTGPIVCVIQANGTNLSFIVNNEVIIPDLYSIYGSKPDQLLLEISSLLDPCYIGPGRGYASGGAKIGEFSIFSGVLSPVQLEYMVANPFACMPNMGVSTATQTYFGTCAPLSISTEATDGTTVSSVLTPVYVYMSSDDATVDLHKQFNLAAQPRDIARMLTTTQTFWTQTISLTDTVRALLRQKPAFALTLAEAAQADSSVELLYRLRLLERLTAQDLRYGQYTLQLVEALQATPTLRAFLAELVSDEVNAEESLSLTDALVLLDALFSQIQTSNQITATRTDFVNALGQLLSAVPAEIAEAIQAEQTLSLNDVLALLDRVHAQTTRQADFSLNRLDSVRARTTDRISFASLLLDSVTAGTEFSFLDVLRLQDALGAQAGYEVVVTSSLVLALLARDYARRIETQLTTEEILADQTFQLEVTKIMALYDELQAALTDSQVLTIMVNDTLEGQAGDSVQALAQYFAQPWDTLGAWVAFRLGEEPSTGWVMNTEGDMPLSEYVGYDFNSFCKVGDVYLGARDEGLYLLDGDTDDGAPIEAAVRTMMLDFGSPVMKRVQNAYIGYTSSGKLMLKVRTVSDGELKEQWYEAQELQAQAPREQMIRVGRGLRSRYWQFELVNVDGSDFELMDLELHPVYLNRRV